jgi:hypothetical protein
LKEQAMHGVGTLASRCALKAFDDGGVIEVRLVAQRLTHARISTFARRSASLMTSRKSA